MNQPVVLLSAFLFAVGLLVVVTRKHAILVLMGIELMLNAANLNLVAFGNRTGHEGIFFALFIILVAVCESAVGIAIILRVYKTYQTSIPDQVNELKETS